MKTTLFQAAHQYVATIKQIEQTRDTLKLQNLEEKRIDLHWQFMEQLKSQGIYFKDRDHATRIAYRIVNGEL